MTALLFLMPVALGLGALGLGAFFWALKSGQFEDPKGSAERILLDDDLKDQND
ncbi:MAG: cbb3-type cytochrome oxidase assembly protein CcoS [Parvularculaceae bacterium]